MLRKAYQYRIEGDYEPMSEFSNKMTIDLLENMKEFISVIKAHIK